MPRFSHVRISHHLIFAVQVARSISSALSTRCLGTGCLLAANCHHAEGSLQETPWRFPQGQYLSAIGKQVHKTFPPEDPQHGGTGKGQGEKQEIIC